jgi:hypothetical protein
MVFPGEGAPEAEMNEPPRGVAAGCGFDPARGRGSYAEGIASEPLLFVYRLCCTTRIMPGRRVATF